MGSFEIEKTCRQFGYFVCGDVALYVFLQIFRLT